MVNMRVYWKLSFFIVTIDSLRVNSFKPKGPKNPVITSTVREDDINRFLDYELNNKSFALLF
jgi:hypothetical protein